MIKKIIFSLNLAAILMLGISSPGWANEVTDEDEAWHDMGRKSRMAYEWFYFDIHNSDGNSLVVTFLGPNPFDIPLPSLISPAGIRKHVGILAQGRTPDGKALNVLNFTRKNDISFKRDPFLLKINQSTLSMKKLESGLREYTILVDGKDTTTHQTFRANLTFTAVMKGWKHKEGYVYNDGKDYHKWFATVPKAKVSGWYEYLDADGRVITHVKLDQASGYHDHNYGTLPMSDTTNGWYWGRAEVGNKTIIYTQVWGRSGPNYFGDLTYKKNPMSTMFFMATEDKVLVDSDKMALNDFGPKNKVTLENGMIVPKNYEMDVKGLDGKFYSVNVTPTSPLSLVTPYYSRQGGTISLCEGRNLVELENCRPDESDVIISEQIDFPRFLKFILFKK